MDDLEVTTLNDGSYMKYKNDASFVLSTSLYMFEQHTDNPEIEIKVLVEEMAEEVAEKRAKEMDEIMDRLSNQS